jgi:hypothetical protein
MVSEIGTGLEGSGTDSGPSTQIMAAISAVSVSFLVFVFMFYVLLL